MQADLLPREGKHSVTITRPSPAEGKHDSRCLVFHSLSGRASEHKQLWFKHIPMCKEHNHDSPWCNGRDGTGSSGCHWINVCEQYRLLIDEVRNTKWPGKTWRRMLSLVRCFSDFHMEQLGRWKQEAIYMFRPNGNRRRGYISCRNAALCIRQETTDCLLTQAAELARWWAARSTETRGSTVTESQGGTALN